jgi:hypothetical protein
MRPDLLARLERLLRRVLTPAGVKVAASVTAAATSVSITWPRAEGDTAYGVVATPNWLTTVAVTAQTTTGCTVTFGTAAPANARLALFTFRED